MKYSRDQNKIRAYLFDLHQLEERSCLNSHKVLYCYYQIQLIHGFLASCLWTNWRTPGWTGKQRVPKLVGVQQTFIWKLFVVFSKAGSAPFGLPCVLSGPKRELIVGKILELFDFHPSPGQSFEKIAPSITAHMLVLTGALISCDLDRDTCVGISASSGFIPILILVLSLIYQW